MSEEPQLSQPDVQAALADLEAAADLPLGERADAFEGFHAALVRILDEEPDQ